MNKEDLLAQISQEFKSVTLGDAYTLAEEDYYDKSHWHFDEKHIDSSLTREEWDKQEIEEMIKHRWWLPEEIEEAIQAIQEKRKMFNRFANPLEIPYKYLEHYYVGFTSLKSQAFLFYTPSMMISALENSEVFKSASFKSWLFCLTWIDTKELLKTFEKTQVDILIHFLKYIFNLDNRYIDKQEIKNCINAVMLLNYYSKEYFLYRITQEFKNITLGDAYTLVEEDYYDTAHCYFNEKHIDSNLTREEWNEQEINLIQTGGWFQEDQKEAIQAIREKRKMSNRFKNPLHIPPAYLNRYFTGFTYLKPEGYIFYTPSMMLYVLYDSEDALRWNGFTWWLFRLNREDNNEVFKCLTQNQLDILIDFLKYLINSDTVNESDKEKIQIALNKI